MRVYVDVCVCECKSLQRSEDPLKMESQEVVSCLMCVLGFELDFSS